MATRIVGKRIKVGGDPAELYRFETSAAPHTEVQRFAFGLWRGSTETSVRTVMSVIGDVQRGLLVDLPVESFDKLDAGIAQVEAALFSFSDQRVSSFSECEQCEPSDPCAPESWQVSIRNQHARVVTKTKFTMGWLGSHTWWMIEGGWLTPIGGRPLSEGYIQKMETATLVSTVESAANKAFVNEIRNVEAMPNRIATKITSYLGPSISDEDIAAGIAATWSNLHAEEQKRRVIEQRRAEEVRLLLAQQEHATRLIEEERQRRIAAGDVSALDDQGLASKLRAKRTKGMEPS